MAQDQLRTKDRVTVRSAVQVDQQKCVQLQWARQWGDRERDWRELVCCGDR